MDPKHQHVLRGVLAAARTEKQALVDRNGIGADMPALVTTAAGTQPIGTYPLPDGRAGKVAAISAAIVLSDCDLAVVVTEVLVADDLNDIDNLNTRFASGDQSVTEGLMFIALPRSDHPRRRIDRYRYHGKRVEWLEPARPTPQFDRSLQQLLEIGETSYRAQEQRCEPAVLTPGAQLQHVGSYDHDADTVLVNFALYHPCPCGSGQPMNQCCALRN